MKYFVRTDSDWSLTFNTLKEAEKCFGNWKDDYLAEGVSLDDSFVEIHQFEEDAEDSKVIKRVEVAVDEEQHRELGSPEENGMEFQFWAKWQEVEC